MNNVKMIIFLFLEIKHVDSFYIVSEWKRFVYCAKINALIVFELNKF